IRLPLISILFPYTTLFRSDLRIRPGLYLGLLAPEDGGHDPAGDVAGDDLALPHRGVGLGLGHPELDEPGGHVDPVGAVEVEAVGDRKSTRLNSSHVKISYA